MKTLDTFRLSTYNRDTIEGGNRMNFPLITFDREKRYAPYNSWSEEYLQQLQELVEASPWRDHYHIEPPHGLLNDPNGFSYFNGQWHLFYQYYPYGPVHGLKSWYHLTSPDLIHWQEHEAKLLPASPYDSHGVYSGSAYQIDNELFLFYTGNVRNEDWTRLPYQNGAFMDSDFNIQKIEQPLIQPLSEATDHFRDPQIFERFDQFWMIIGAQRKSDQTGTLYLYKAKDKQVTDWEMVREIPVPSAATSFMFECPNLIFIDGTPVLLFCPQGISQEELNYQNIYPNAYFIAENFTEDGELVNQGPLHNLDSGFDAYATQAFNAPDGRALGISWLGLPDISYPSDAYGYQGALSLVKEYTIKDGKLYQFPVAETRQLRKNSHELTEHVNLGHNHFELEAFVDADQTVTFNLYANEEQTKYVKLIVDTSSGLVTLDREHMGTLFAQDYGTQRQAQLPSNSMMTLNIYADTSTLEIYINQGEVVLSSRIFTQTSDQTHINIEGTTQGTLWELRR